MKTSWVVLLVAALVLIGGIYWFSHQQKSSIEPTAEKTQEKTAKTPTKTSPSTTVRVSIAKFAFSPNQISVKVGTTVIWTNNDSVTHTVTSDTRSFDSQKLLPGESFSHAFDSKGTFSYHCDIHPSMHGTVSVTP